MQWLHIFSRGWRMQRFFTGHEPTTTWKRYPSLSVKHTHSEKQAGGKDSAKELRKKAGTGGVHSRSRLGKKGRGGERRSCNRSFHAPVSILILFLFPSADGRRENLLTGLFPRRRRRRFRKPREARAAAAQEGGFRLLLLFLLRPREIDGRCTFDG